MLHYLFLSFVRIRELYFNSKLCNNKEKAIFCEKPSFSISSFLRMKLQGFTITCVRLKLKFMQIASQAVKSSHWSTSNNHKVTFVSFASPQIYNGQTPKSFRSHLAGRWNVLWLFPLPSRPSLNHTWKQADCYYGSFSPMRFTTEMNEKQTCHFYFWFLITLVYFSNLLST